jgi:hypothetical protein
VAASIRQIAIDWIEEGFPQSLDTVVELALQMTLLLQPAEADS